jgi:hypothetical protein
VVLAVVLAVMVVGVASGAQSDQGRRLAGPFCVGKSGLKNMEVTRRGGPVLGSVVAGGSSATVATSARASA